MRKKYKRSFDEIQKIVAATDRFFAQENIDESLRMKADLSLEELFVNMVTYNTETSRDILIEMKAIDKGIYVLTPQNFNFCGFLNLKSIPSSSPSLSLNIKPLAC